VASLHTPFRDDGVIDEAGLARLVEHCVAAGCSGVLATAVAGEVRALEPTERRAVLAAVARAAAGRLAIIAGVSAPDVATSAALAADAAAHCATMVLWQPPAGLDEDGLAAGLRSIAGAGSVQVMLQDLDWHGPGIPPETIARLAARVPAFTAVKIETVPAGPKYTTVQEACGGRLHLSGGWAAMQMLDGLARGIDAFIPSGLLPAYVRIFHLWSAGRREEARAAFERALPVIAFSNQHINVSIPFWKHVRRRQGLFDTERCRPPIPALDPVQQAEAERLAAIACALDES
jgi:4-hydroxy-tetrahydrodipicolinate synthase